MHVSLSYFDQDIACWMDFCSTIKLRFMNPARPCSMGRCLYLEGWILTNVNGLRSPPALSDPRENSTSTSTMEHAIRFRSSFLDHINNILYKLENSSEINFILLFWEFYKILIQVRNSDKRSQTIIIKPSFALLHPKKLNVDRKFDY